MHIPDDENDALPAIAVVGMSFHFAGGAANANSFWQMLLDGRCAASDVPSDRFNANSFYHPDTNRLDTLPIRQAHFLQGDVAAFDAPFFSISAPEAAAMDPQSRHLLEASYRALENAGISIDKVAGSRTSVHIGASAEDYNMIYTKDPEWPIRHAATGKAASMLANKISWFFDFKGPSLRIDTACSASLNALHLACQALRTGESDMGLVGGANLFLSPDSLAPLAHLNFFSPDGRCYSFDHRANGYSRGEGFGIIVIKLLSQALKDGDTVRAVIRASGSNENGRTAGGIARVNRDAQENLVRETYERAGLSLKDTKYVEAHAPGTGGDAVETGALVGAFAKFRTREDPLCLGSVKANVGHLEGGSGIASIVKAVLMLEQGIMPRLANFERVNPAIDAGKWNLELPVENIPWSPGLRRISVNSFGFGGSNAHVVIEDAHHHLKRRRLHGNHSTQLDPALKNGGGSLSSNARTQPYLNGYTDHSLQEARELSLPKLLVWSAADQRGLERMAEVYSEHFTNAASPNPAYLDNLAYTLAMRRSHLPWRSFIIANSLPEAQQVQLKMSTAVRATNMPKLNFIFTGQGAQVAQMGRELLQYPTFRASLERSRDHLRNLGCQWDLIEELLRNSSESNVDHPEYSQPLCTALQIALVDLLHISRIYPSAVVGHSSGEIAAAYCAGALSNLSACKVAYFRGLLSARLLGTSRKCGMLAVALSAEAVQHHVEDLTSTNRTRRIWIGCINSPNNVTLTGDKTRLQEIQNQLESRSIFARMLKVNMAYHSPYMRSIAEEYETALGDLEVGIVPFGGVTIFSTVTGKKVQVEEMQDAGYWSRNLTSPVLFAQALEEMVSSRSTKTTGSPADRLHPLLEIGPHPALRGPVRETLSSLSKAEMVYLSVLDRNVAAMRSFLELLGRLHCLGYEVKLDAHDCFGKNPVSLTDLPEYPFNHSRSYWHESRLSRNYRLRKYPRTDLLGVRVPDWNPLEARWRNIIRTLENPWIEDHKINGVLIYPGAGMLVIAIEAAAQLAQDLDERQPTGFRMKDVTFPKSLNISLQPEGVETEIYLRPLRDAADRQAAWSEFRLCLLENGEWADTCRGQILVEYEESFNEVDGGREARERARCYGETHSEALRRCNKPVETRKVYESLQAYGLETGPTFRVFQDVHCNSQREASAHILLRQWALKGNPDHSQPHIIHPTALDGTLQLGIVALTKGGKEKIPTMVPSRIRNLWLSNCGLSGEDVPYVIGSARSSYRGYRETNMDVLVMDKTGQDTRIVVEGLETVIIGNRESTMSVGRQLCYKMEWKPDLEIADIATVVAYCGNPPYLPGDAEDQSGKLIARLEAATAPLLLYLDAAVHKNPKLRVLEAILADNPTDFTNQPFLEGEKSEGRLPDSVQYALVVLGQKVTGNESSQDYTHSPTLDSSLDLVSQGLEAASCDLIVMQVVHTSKRSMKSALKGLHKLLRPNGRLFCATMDKESSGKLLRENFILNGFTAIYPKAADLCSPSMPGFGFIIAEPADQTPRLPQRLHNVAILVNEKSSIQRELAVALSATLKRRGVPRLEISSLPRACAATNLSETQYICLLDVSEAFFAQVDPIDFRAFKQVATCAKMILWVSSPMQQGRAHQGIVTGLARTLRTEYTDLKFVTMELHEKAKGDLQTANTIATIFESTVQAPVEVCEPEYVQREDCLLYINRVIRDAEVNQDIATRMTTRRHEIREFGSHPALKLGIANPGLLDSLQFQEDFDTSKALSADEIEVAPAFCGLNFMDCLVALGRVPQDTLGVECAGVVTRSGESSDLVPGDRVMLCTDGTMQTKTRCHYMSAAKIPDDMSFEEAAALPGTAATIYQALYNVARLQSGESILIHAGAGATGQMAIQMATSLGATIYATVGSADKKKLLMEVYGLAESNIFYSRNTSFAEGIHRVTNGQGVDVILNSLAGDSLVASWECIAPFGRFIEIGKRDIYAHKQLPMYPFAKSTSFSVVDLTAIWQQRPRLMRTIFEAVLAMVKKGMLHIAKPLHIYPLSKLEDAFRLLQSGKSTGKLVLQMDKHDLVPTLLDVKPTYMFDKAATYVIAGGLGGLGRSTVRWMSRRGARHLILLSRSGPHTEDAKALVRELSAAGVKVKTPSCDITDGAALSKILEESKRNMPQIKGCIQASMVLKDKYFSDMDESDWSQATTAKVMGSWNLHTHLPSGLDFFILFSSMAGVIGGPGQANYAAGNTYEDGLARYRVSMGEKAVSLGLGMMVSDGVLAENQKLMRALDSTGAYMHMTIEELHALLDRYCDPHLGLLQPDDAQVVCGIELPSAIQAKGVKEPVWMSRPLFRHFHHMDSESLGATSISADNTVDYKALFATSQSLSDAGALVAEALVKKLSHSLAMPTSDIDTSKPLHYYGVDSLVAVELRNWFAKELSADVAIFDILGNRSCAEVGVLAAGRSAFRRGEWHSEIDEATDIDSPGLLA